MSAADSQAIATWVYVVITFFLLLVAWFQLRGLSQSNKLVAESNQQLAASNKALVRPYVVVDFGFKRHHRLDPDNPMSASLTIEVSNIGRTSAQEIRVVTSPTLNASLTTIAGDKPASERQLAKLREIFDGEKSIRSLTPGRTITYVLDRLPDAMTTKDIPKGYDLAVSYRDVEGEVFEESYRMDFEGWEVAVGWGEDIGRISKDLQALNETMKKLLNQMSS